MIRIAQEFSIHPSNLPQLVDAVVEFLLAYQM